MDAPYAPIGEAQGVFKVTRWDRVRERVYIPGPAAASALCATASLAEAGRRREARHYVRVFPLV